MSHDAPNSLASPDTTIAQDAISARFLGASTARKTTKKATTATSTKTTVSSTTTRSTLKSIKDSTDPEYQPF